MKISVNDINLHKLSENQIFSQNYFQNLSQHEKSAFRNGS